MMDYALNPHHSELHGQLMQWLSTPTAATDAAKWLLLDAAMFEEKAFLRLMKGQESACFRNIFTNTRKEDYSLKDPHLIILDALERTRQKVLLQSLLNLTSGIPAVAALDAGADAAALSSCLAWFAQTRTLDGLELYCRVADTRITPGLLQALDNEQSAKLGQLVLQWQVINRHGAWEALLPDSKAQPNVYAPVAALDTTQPFILSDGQYAMLMQKAEPDALFQLLCEGNPELVPDEGRGEFHQRLAAIVARAHQHGLESGPDIVLFAVVALTTQDGFDTHPALKESWLSVQQKTASFSELVAAWPEAMWDALSQPVPFP